MSKEDDLIQYASTLVAGQELTGSTLGDNAKTILVAIGGQIAGAGTAARADRLVRAELYSAKHDCEGALPDSSLCDTA